MHGMRRFACLLLAACSGVTPLDSDAATDDASAGDGIATDVSAIDAVHVSDAAPFSVANVQGLVLWLDANVSSSITQSNGRVSMWVDQSAHKNDAKVGSIAAHSPSLNASAIHGVPALHFTAGASNESGNQLGIDDNADLSLRWGAGDFYLAVVGDFDNNPSDGFSRGVGVFYTKDTTGQSGITGVALSGNVPMGTQGTPTLGVAFQTAQSDTNTLAVATAYNDGKPHVFAARRTSAVLTIIIDGAIVASATSTDVNVDNANMGVRIGADVNASLVRLDGDIAEMIAVKGAISSSDEANVESYLQQKYSTP
jgi:hypothetical protein